jgi:hypothetical protein
LERCADGAGRPTLWSEADQAVARGATTYQEITRVLGPQSATVVSSE